MLHVGNLDGHWTSKYVMSSEWMKRKKKDQGNLLFRAKRNESFQNKHKVFLENLGADSHEMQLLIWGRYYAMIQRLSRYWRLWKGKYLKIWAQIPTRCSFWHGTVRFYDFSVKLKWHTILKGLERKNHANLGADSHKIKLFIWYDIGPYSFTISRQIEMA